MDIEVFKRVGTSGFNFKSAGILDVFESLTVNWRYYTYSQFSLKILLEDVQKIIFNNSEEIQRRKDILFSLFISDNILNINNVYFYIDRVVCDDSTKGEVVISGKSLRAKSLKRIVYRIYHQTKKPEQIIYDHLNNEVVNPSQASRKIQYLSITSPGTLSTSTVDYQNSYGVVCDEVDALCSTYDIGIRETATNLQNPHNKLEIVKGKDLSDVVEFNVDFDNLLSESYESSNFDEATMAWVFGEGDGSARLNVKLNDNLAGLEREEVYVDARDIQKQTQDGSGKDITLTDAQYKAALTSRGIEKLAEQVKVLTLNGDIDLESNLFVYGKDYQIGDRVRFTSKLFNLTKTSVLAGINETWDSTGHHMSPLWDKESPTVFDIIKRRLSK
ncbi:siphovirus ReqiPepy6 Gp37-like family protein [Lactococcus petauri]|uniref:siphovirus ReqiPepy6 Gp37-like family protein n=1 Tax=Lactococcus petauri TaxID=1940789 RepID=UPI0027EA95E9|nr:siphovirus ReqiPepy6 Gp37-like family protein [Lactococcus petauri]MDQ7119797.1 siphovirus ReqiPepy6 Gp37-like family protein [Lactococcus petauri]MDQ7125342.1 siphovirus ReqiPepy6 Gp37-like family protein [Lactococcus petauri]MDQ7126321.1 siphovirus ReqiPepy6 Gp37-like family protein [Lactococcus petauri]MDQ7128228.1 siphovirus ReqiPepy6 Gp37-like family protein [Lactococcus petauri]MDQ7138062.1 siphovirus ReqiPepy6 Gp37-like family protein [Lactococcus petauri]